MGRVNDEWEMSEGVDVGDGRGRGGLVMGEEGLGWIG